ncbi:MAG TPA: FAD-dependent oxidoreductase, partial [Ureibacillus sp.]|nr:FAD-dependent oxidoreductase [Ureibacillus sp.]
TAIRQNARSVHQFGKHPELPKARQEDRPWPQDPNVYKLDYAYEEVEAAKGRDPREYCIQTKEIVKDKEGNVKELHTIQMEKILGDDGFHFFKEIPGTEKVWPAQAVFVAIGFEGVEKSVPEQFGVNLANNKIRASIKDFETNVPGVFAAGDARRGQSLVVWAIKEGRSVAASVHEFITSKVNV